MRLNSSKSILALGAAAIALAGCAGGHSGGTAQLPPASFVSHDEGAGAA